MTNGYEMEAGGSTRATRPVRFRPSMRLRFDPEWLRRMHLGAFERVTQVRPNEASHSRPVRWAARGKGSPRQLP